MLLAAALFLAAQPLTEPTDGCPGIWVPFEAHSARLNREALESIERLLLWVRPMTSAGAWLNVIGTANDAGSADANMRLSRRRAETVRDYLLRRGFRGEQLRVLPRGDRGPPVTADPQPDSEAERAINRVTIVHPEMPLSVFHRFVPPGGPIC